jgi:serine phosphatase RsbU (regulator of sigma subunit)
MQKDIILDELKDYQGNSNRRDDITMIGFRV